MSDIGKLFLKKWPWKCQIGFDLSVQKCCKHHIMIFFFFFFLLGAVELFNFPDFVTDRRKCKIESRAGCLEKKPVFCWYCRYYFAAFYDQASWSRTSNSWVIFFFFCSPWILFYDSPSLLSRVQFRKIRNKGFGFAVRELRLARAKNASRRKFGKMTSCTLSNLSFV